MTRRLACALCLALAYVTMFAVGHASADPFAATVDCTAATAALNCSYSGSGSADVARIDWDAYDYNSPIGIPARTSTGCLGTSPGAGCVVPDTTAHTFSIPLPVDGFYFAHPGVDNEHPPSEAGPVIWEFRALDASDVQLGTFGTPGGAPIFDYWTATTGGAPSDVFGVLQCEDSPPDLCDPPPPDAVSLGAADQQRLDLIWIGTFLMCGLSVGMWVVRWVRDEQRKWGGER